MTDRVNLKNLLPSEVEEFAVELGQPRYKGKQLFRWIWHRRQPDFAGMTDLSKKFRELLEEKAYLPNLELNRHDHSASQDTSKYLFKLEDGSLVESVKMRYLDGSLGPGRVAICISSQVGCAMACDFCASGLAGLKRNLQAWEIADQALQIQRTLDPVGERVANVVYMGIGEPFHNFDNVMRSIRILNWSEGLGIGMRHLTISTSGLVPQIRKLAQERLPIRLAISLHATNDELRDKIMPVNKRWPIAELLAACKEYQQLTGRRVTMEYVLLDGVNDSLAEADALGRMLRDLHSLVNLIPWNPVNGAPYHRSKPGRIRAFQERVEMHGIKCTVRQEKGADIDAACGQLRLQAEDWMKRPRSATA